VGRYRDAGRLTISEKAAAFTGLTST